jgi:hypothetical protein
MGICRLRGRRLRGLRSGELWRPPRPLVDAANPSRAAAATLRDCKDENWRCSLIDASPRFKVKLERVTPSAASPQRLRSVSVASPQRLRGVSVASPWRLRGASLAHPCRIPRFLRADDGKTLAVLFLPPRDDGRATKNPQERASSCGSLLTFGSLPSILRYLADLPATSSCVHLDRLSEEKANINP